MERTPYNDLSQHDKELLAKINKIDDLQSFVEKERPSLIGQPYRIEFSQQHI